MAGVAVEAIEGCFRRLDEGPKEFTEREGRFLGFGMVL